MTRYYPCLLILLLCALATIGCERRERPAEEESLTIDSNTVEEAEALPDTSIEETPLGGLTSPSGNIVVTAPGKGQRVRSEGFVLKGRARTFENAVSYKVLNAAGGTIIEGHLTAAGAMGSLNPFTAEIAVRSGYTGPATLEVFQYSARDGSPIDMVRIPIVVGHESAEEGAMLRIYFTNSRLNGNGDCENVFSTPRMRGETVAVAEAALRELLKGPTAEEQAEGYATEIPSRTKLRGVRINQGTAVADFSVELNGSAGSCRVAAIRAQIERTLKQFPTVTSVVISVEGESREALQP